MLDTSVNMPRTLGSLFLTWLVLYMTVERTVNAVIADQLCQHGVLDNDGYTYARP